MKNCNPQNIVKLGMLPAYAYHLPRRVFLADVPVSLCVLVPQGSLGNV